MEKLQDPTFIIKSLAFTAVYTTLGYVFPLQQGSPTPTYIIGTIITGLLYAFILGFTLSEMPISRRGRVFTVWIAIYVIQMFNPLLEGIFFTDMFEDTTLIFGAIIFGMLIPLILSITSGFLFSPEDTTSSLRDKLKDYLGMKKPIDWAWRLVAASLAWTIIYYVFGSLVAPIVVPYYTDPNSGFNLVLPSVEVVLTLQAVRGFLYVGSLLPLVSVLKIDKRRLWAILTGFLFVGGGLAIFIVPETFPQTLRIVHGLEIFADSLIYGGVLAYLLNNRARQLVT